MIQEFESGIRIKLFVQPKASKNQIIGPHNGALKIKITAPPIDGRANNEIIDFFSDILKISKRNIEILKGDHGRHKILQIIGLSKQDFQKIIS